VTAEREAAAVAERGRLQTLVQSISATIGDALPTQIAAVLKAEVERVRARGVWRGGGGAVGSRR
jgi:hypothetical protein